jgi:Cu2+-exporting ATPase
MTTHTQEFNFAIEGMRCGACALSLEKRLRAFPGVASARANATTHQLAVTAETHLSVSDIEGVVEGAGFHAIPKTGQKTGQTSDNGVLMELAVAGFGLMNVMLFSFSVWAGLASDMGGGTVDFMNRAAAALTTPVLIFAARPFYLSALSALLARRMSMDVAITIAIFGTFFASVTETIMGAEHVYFDAALSLTFFLLIGRQLDAMMRRRSATATDNLRLLLDSEATRLGAGDAVSRVPVTALTPNDRILVAKGERVPADGLLESGAALLDESILSGEIDPVEKVAGGEVVAGSLNLGSPFVFVVSRSGEDTSLEQIASIAQSAGEAKSQRQQMADKFASNYGPVVLGAALFAFLLWYLILGADAGQAFQVAIAVLVVTCPCAAGLATPAVTSKAANLMLERGLLLRNAAALEYLPGVDLFACDKTGTLSTVGKPDQSNDLDALEAASRLAQSSSHPISRSLAAAGSGIAAQSVREIAGRGLVGDDGSVLGSSTAVGVDSEHDEVASVWVKSPGQAPMPLNFEEHPKDGLTEFLDDLKNRGVRVVLISGDRAASVDAFGHRVGLDDLLGGVTPVGKLTQLEEWRKEGATIAMAGDGLNDVAALQAADVSFSFSEASDATRNAADIIVLGNSLTPISYALDIAKVARRKMSQNLTFAAAYNILTVPIAIAGFLTPFWAAIFMSTSSIAVMLNAHFLKAPK